MWLSDPCVANIHLNLAPGFAFAVRYGRDDEFEDLMGMFAEALANVREHPRMHDPWVLDLSGPFTRSAKDNLHLSLTDSAQYIEWLDNLKIRLCQGDSIRTVMSPTMGAAAFYTYDL